MRGSVMPRKTLPAEEDRRARPLRGKLLVAASFLAAYLACNHLATIFLTPDGVSTWYPPPGLSLALLLSCGLAYAPLIPVAAALHCFIFTPLSLAPGTVLLVALLKAIGYTLAAAFLLRVVHIDPRLRRMRDMAWFSIAALVGSLAVAVASRAATSPPGTNSWFQYTEALLTFWIGDTIGILILTPFLTTTAIPWIREQAGERPALQEQPWQGPAGFDLLEFLGEFGSIILALWIVFLSPLAGTFHLFYLFFIPVVGIALRHGLPRTTLAVLVTNTGATLTAHWSGLGTRSVIEFQTFMLVLTLTGLFFGSTVTERKRTEQALEHRVTQLALINDTGRRIAAALDLEEMLSRTTHLVQRRFDYHHVALFVVDRERQEASLEAAAGAYTSFIPADYHLELNQGIVGWVARRGETRLSNDVRRDPYYIHGLPEDVATRSELAVPIRASGETIGVLDVQSPHPDAFDDGDVLAMETLADQIAVAIHNARLFRDMRQQSELVRALAIRLAEVEEIERQRLARELHDQVGQNLTALGINLNIVQAQIPDASHSPARHRLDDSLSLVEQTTERIRDLMADLRPPVLDDYGLVAALRWYGEQFAARSGINVIIDGEEIQPRLSPRAEGALFRIAQEALTNVAKHAQASQATVAVKAGTDLLQMVITDNGLGFDPAQRSEPGERYGWGMLTMTERAAAIGGRFEVESQPGRGTRVVVEVPR